jgi:GntR family transcriptional regulator/MocR family aminotransferase
MRYRAGMRRVQWDFALTLDRAERQPLYLQISRALVGEICRGRLRPGDVLPGTRTLAETLKVNRITVLTAYEELAAEGWITTRPAQGSRVAAQLPDDARGTLARSRPKQTPEPVPPFPLPPVTPVARSPEHLRGVLVLGASSPDPRLLDVEPLARAYRRALRWKRGRLLGYSEPQGHPRLRAAIAEMLRAVRGLSVMPDNIFVTRGSLMALNLTARSLLAPRDAVVVEALGYRPAWQAFAAAGAVVVPAPVDEQGLDTHSLARLLPHHPVRAVYVTPHRQFPTTVTLSPGRRHHLLALARQHRFVVIEDDYDHEFQFEGREVTPLASQSGTAAVIYVGSFSKLVAPGIRLGFVAGPANVLDRLTAQRETLDMQGDLVMEAAIAELIEDGEIQRHVRRARRVYRTRRDLLAQLLQEKFGTSLEFQLPSGGVALWIRARGLDVERWAAEARVEGVAFQTAREFRFDSEPEPGARLGYACLNDDELRDAVHRMSLALGKSRLRPGA